MSSEIHGPPLDPFFGKWTGHGLQLLSDRFSIMKTSLDSKSGMTQFNFFGKIVYLPTNPQIISEVTGSKSKSFSRKSSGYVKLQEYFGKGLLSIEGEEWKESRKLINNFFQSKHLDKSVDPIKMYLLKESKAWKEQKTINVSEKMNHFALYSLSTVLFGLEVDDLQEKLLKIFPPMMELFGREINDNFPIKFGFRKKRLYRYRQKLWAVIDEFMQKALSSDGDNFVKYIINEMKVSHKRAREDLVHLILAGHETSAHVLTWGLVELAKNKEWQSVLASEWTSYSLELNKISDYKKPKRTYLFVLELLRKYPAFIFFARLATQDVNLCGYQIQKGQTVLLSPYMSHYSNFNFESPESFLPNRFNEIPESDFPKMGYFPFGQGSRICIGQNLAMFELVTCLMYICNHFEFELKGPTPAISPDFILKPVHDVFITLSPKTSHDV